MSSLEIQLDESRELNLSCETTEGPHRCRAGVLAAGIFSIALGGLLPGAAKAETAVLQGLDKITARISTFEAPVNQAAQFGSLEITVRRCDKTPPEEPPESAAFMEIVDNRPDSPSVLLFSGWMFASSPAVSALEHPVYDVWVIDCKADPTLEELTLEELEALEAQEAETEN
jgi:hypothetical protein